MNRRVIQIAKSTQLISLPRKWAQQHHIKKGDELEITENGAKLVISIGKPEERDKMVVRLPTAEKFLQRPLANIYRRGYDEVTILFSDPSVTQLISKQIENMLGFEIIEQSEGKVTLHMVASALDSEFESVFRRLFLMVAVMTKDIADATSNGNFAKLEEIKNRERTNDKLTMFCQRLLNKRGYPQDPRRAPMLYETVCQLEYIGDDLRDICRFLLKNKKCGKETEQLLFGLNELTSILYNLYFKYDISQLVKFKEKKESVQKEGLKILSRQKSTDSITAHYVLDAMDKLHHITEDIVTEDLQQ